MAGNPFDQFDSVTNPFDQFDDVELPGGSPAAENNQDESFIAGLNKRANEFSQTDEGKRFRRKLETGDDGVSAGETTAAGAFSGVLGLSESIWDTPDALARWSRELSQSTEDLTGLPRAVNPIRAIQYTADWLAHGKVPWSSEAGTGGASDVAQRISDAHASLSQNYDPFKYNAESAQKADLAFKKAIDGDMGGLVDISTDPKAVGGFIGQAAPSLVTSYMSGGSMPFMAWMEAMQVSQDARDFEQRTGQKISDRDFMAAQAQTGVINGLLEKVVPDQLLKGEAGKTFLAAIVTGMKESGTEAAQQLNQNLAEKLTFDKDKELHEGVVSSAIGGFGSGVAAGTGQYALNNAAAEDQQQSETAIDENISPEASTPSQGDDFADKIAAQGIERQAEIDAAMPEDTGPHYNVNPVLRAQTPQVQAGRDVVPETQGNIFDQFDSAETESSDSSSNTAQFDFTERESGTILVKGDRDAIRKHLADSGINAKGMPSTDGLIFGKKLAPTIKNTLTRTAEPDVAKPSGATETTGGPTAIESNAEPTKIESPVIVDGVIDEEKTKATLPDVEPGHTRLYRASSPTVKFEDVFDAEKLKKYSQSGLKGKYYTENLGYADYFRSTYGKDASIDYVDIPTSELDGRMVAPEEYVIDFGKGQEKPNEQEQINEIGNTKETPAPAGVSVSVEPHGKNSIIAKGDKDAMRARLEKAGVTSKGMWNKKHNGLVFSGKHEAAVREALSGDRRTNPERLADDLRTGNRRKYDVLRDDIASIADPEERAQAVEELRRMALTDHRTGLASGLALEQHLRMLDKIGKPYRLASLDVAGLKWVNDNMNPAVGDELIAKSGEMLTIANEEFGYFLASPKGDEFYVVVEGESDVTLRDMVRKAQMIGNQAVLTYTLSDGTVIEKRGIDLYAGYGKSQEAADADLNNAKERAKSATKAERQAKGITDDRLAEPRGVVRRTSEGRNIEDNHPAEEVATTTKTPAPAGVSVSDDNKAAAILDAANIRGKDRLDIMRDFREGKYSLKDLKEAYPAAESNTSQEPKPKQDAISGDVLEETSPSNQEKIEDFGEKLGGARKDKAKSYQRELSDDDIASLPLSKIWPKEEVEAIEDHFVAAFATAARAEIPNKPRVKYKVKRWVDTVKMMRSAMVLIEMHGKNNILSRLEEFPSLAGFRNKVDLLSSIEREHWRRIGEVEVWANAYRYGENGEKIPSPSVSVEIDGYRKRFEGATSINDALDQIKEKLSGEVIDKKLKFEIRGYRGQYTINKKGDKEQRPLKSFDDLTNARKFITEHHDQLVDAWEGIKARDNVKKTDVRNKENRPRSGADHRQGKDVTPEMFSETFGFRGVEFGNWVKQGKNGKERQGMINLAYDALIDLSSIVGVPPKAISLNGELGLGFGSRGSGNASAHFEPDTIVINLTKTKGAGSLAHEWFHALDHYFQRQRKPGKTREDSYITYRPEPMMVHKTAYVAPMTKAELNRRQKQYPDAGVFKRENWMLDPKHPGGVRPEVERRFAEVVNALNTSPMKGRSLNIDQGKADGYWSRIIERGARAFENYVIAKMAQHGYHNDYLANVTSIERFARNPQRYPYLLEEELEPVVEAFDDLFETIETKETDKGVALFARKRSGGKSMIGFPDAIIAAKHGSSREHQDYAAAKAGDTEAAYRLVSDILPKSAIMKLRKALDGRKPEIVPVFAMEAKGKNKIPLAYASILGKRLDLDVNDRIVQASKVSRTGSNGFHRLANRPQFDGDVTPGKDYLIVDDTIAQGGTIAALKAHIEAGGGNVILASTLTGKGYSATLSPTESTINKLRDKHGTELEQWWKDTFGYGYEHLTESEARYLANVSSADAIRDRVTSARNEGVSGDNAQLGRARRRVGKDNSKQEPGNAGFFIADEDVFRTGAVPLRHVDVATVEQAVASVVLTWSDNAPSVEVVKSETDLPSHIRSQIGDYTQDDGIVNKGVLDSATRTVYLIADGLESKRDALTILAHEAVGHYGMEEMLGPDQFTQLVKRVQWMKKAGNKKVRALADQVKEFYGEVDQNTEAKEIIAIMAEHHQLQSVFGKTMNGIRQAVRQFLRKLGFKVMFSTNDIDAMLARAGKFLRQSGGKARQIGGVLHHKNLGEIAVEMGMDGQYGAGKFASENPEIAANLAAEVAGAKVVQRDNETATLKNNEATFHLIKEGGRWVLTDVDADAVSFARKNTSSNSAFNLRDTLQRRGEQLSEAFDKFRYEAQDKHIYLKRLQDAIGNVTEDTDAYGKEELYHGRVRYQIDKFHDDMVNPLLELISKSGKSLDEVEQYLHARHAEEANKALREINDPKREGYDALSGMTDKEARQILRENESDKVMKAIGLAADQIGDFQLAALEQNGLESSEYVKAVRNKYNHYVPLKRETEPFDVQAAGPSRGSGYNTARKFLRGRAGSTKAVENILPNLIAQAETTIINAEKAKVHRSVYKLAMENPDPDFWELDTSKKRYTTDKNGNVRLTASPFDKDAENTLRARINGEDHVIRFNSQNEHAMKMVAALRNMDQAQVGILVRTGLMLNRYLSAINTGFNPEFIISNAARDIQTAVYNLSSTKADGLAKRMIKDWPKAFAGIRSALRSDGGHAWAKHFEAFREAGAMTGWLEHTQTVDDFRKKLNRDVSDLGKSRRAKTKRGIRKVLDLIEDYNMVVENAVRLSAFVNAREEGISTSDAARLAKNLTVNFNRRGNKGVVLNGMYLFYNASIQGSARLLQTIATSKKGRRLVAGTIAFAVMMDLLNRSMGGDDDDDVPWYDKIDDSVKERNLIFMDPFSDKGDYYKFPLPWGYNVFHVVGQKTGKGIYTAAYPDSPTAKRTSMNDIADIIVATANAFNPIGGGTVLQTVSPTVLDPVVQVQENKSWTGNDLMPEDMFGQESPDSQKAWRSTPQAFKDVAEWMNEVSGGNAARGGFVDVSPETIQMGYDTLTGGLGRFVTGTFDTLQKAVDSDLKLEPKEAPLIRKVAGVQNQYADQSLFYDRAAEVRTLQEEIDLYRGKPQRREILEERGGLRRMFGMLETTEKRLKLLRKRYQRAFEAGDDEKMEKLKQDIWETHKRFNRRYDKVVD